MPSSISYAWSRQQAYAWAPRASSSNRGSIALCAPFRSYYKSTMEARAKSTRSIGVARLTWAENGHSTPAGKQAWPRVMMARPRSRNARVLGRTRQPSGSCGWLFSWCALHHAHWKEPLASSALSTNGLWRTTLRIASIASTKRKSGRRPLKEALGPRGGAGSLESSSASRSRRLSSSISPGGADEAWGHGLGWKTSREDEESHGKEGGPSNGRDYGCREGRSLVMNGSGRGAAHIGSRQQPARRAWCHRVGGGARVQSADL
jgi:hypothetical protein